MIFAKGFFQTMRLPKKHDDDAVDDDAGEFLHKHQEEREVFLQRVMKPHLPGQERLCFSSPSQIHAVVLRFYRVYSNLSRNCPGGE